MTSSRRQTDGAPDSTGEVTEFSEATDDQEPKTPRPERLADGGLVLVFNNTALEFDTRSARLLEGIGHDSIVFFEAYVESEAEIADVEDPFGSGFAMLLRQEVIEEIEGLTRRKWGFSLIELGSDDNYDVVVTPPDEQAAMVFAENFALIEALESEE